MFTISSERSRLSDTGQVVTTTRQLPYSFDDLDATLTKFYCLIAIALQIKDFGVKPRIVQREPGFAVIDLGRSNRLTFKVIDLSES